MRVTCRIGAWQTNQDEYQIDTVSKETLKEVARSHWTRNIKDAESPRNYGSQVLVWDLNQMDTHLLAVYYPVGERLVMLRTGD